MNTDLISSSSEETERIGKVIGENLPKTALVLLSGDLGSGKTVLTKGIGVSLGIDPAQILSPTFTLMNIYEGIVKIFHLDLYRIGGSTKTDIPEIDDNLGSGIIVVEWAQYLDRSYYREKDVVKVELRSEDPSPNRRNINIWSRSLNIPFSEFKF